MTATLAHGVRDLSTVSIADAPVVGGKPANLGEHSPRVRHATALGLSYLGVALDDGRNRDAVPDADLSAAGATVRTLVIAAREDLYIARGTREALAR